MRTLAILGLIAVAVYLIYTYLKKVSDKINIRIAFKGVDLGNTSVPVFLSSLNAGIVNNVKLKLAAIITNDNSFSIPFSNLVAELFYDGILVAKTTDELSQKKFVVPANGQLEVLDNVNVFLNAASVKLLTQTLNNQKPTITYSVRVKIFFIPVSFTGTFNS